MMQIYVDAIQGSMTGFPQYVMQKSLQLERTKNKEYVIDCLKNGWEMKGAYIDGIGYEVYKADAPEQIKMLKTFITKGLKAECPKFNEPDVSNEAITFYFQEFYKSSDASRELCVDILFSATNLDTEMEESRWLHLDPTTSDRLEDFLIQFGIHQDNNYWIERLQKELSQELQSLESEEHDYD